MQFNIALIASAILMAVSPVLGADFQWWSGAGCTGSVHLTSDNIPANECFGLSDGESTKSISYSGVPTQARFFRSGGSQDFCTNGPPTVTTGGGSGCATAPDGSTSRALPTTDGLA
ncbi:hypothetical protein FB45DRAFT_1006932 [Roridomyces roridus]|uniref:Uncharacterized protein n=1 Tax=Roridomyces roridus TaxID=1738132 RepID=A0AAD7BGW0_9AGAR|nr:hypothetical protein FB45DRAFT_1006932 [Roridomyces roridus]